MSISAGDGTCSAALQNSVLDEQDGAVSDIRRLEKPGKTRHSAEALLEFLHRPCTLHDMTMQFIDFNV